MTRPESDAAEVAFSLVALHRNLPPAPRKLLVLARAQSLAEGPKQRAIHLTVALDASGSMDGVKMHAAIATLHALIDELGPSDSFGLVTFSNIARVLAPAAPMNATGKQIAHACLAQVRSDGGTDLAGAVLTALRESERVRAEHRHVIVLTDGYPTAGVRDDEPISRLVEGARGEATLSLFGFGEDVRPELLARLAEVGGGRYHFVPGTEPPVEAFAAELGQQRSQLAVDVSLALTAGQGVSVDYVPALANVERDAAGVVRISMPALLAGDTRCVVVGIDVGAEAFALDGATPWLGAKLRYRLVADGTERIKQAQLLPVLAAVKSPPVREVAREFVVQRLSELVLAIPSWTAELEGERAALLDFAMRMDLAADPQVVAGLALLSRLIKDMGDASRRKGASVAARAAARGIYDREVTGLGLGPAYVKRRTLLTIDRMSKNMGRPGGKPGGELN